MTTHRLDWTETPPASCRAGAVSIGNFDGAHLGHVALIHETSRRAGLLEGPAVALTFDPHPIHLLRPEIEQPAITTVADRARLLHEHGADEVVILKPSEEFLQLTPEAFFRTILLDHFDAHALVEGRNFGFGRDRSGDIDTLKTLCEKHGRELSIVPPVLVKGAPISSSRIRAALLKGEVSDASRFLGRDHRIVGKVVEGEKRGRSLGFPTANLGEIQELIPADGVYAVRATVKDYPWRGAANLGPNPTFGNSQRKIEVHLIDFTGDLYGETLAVDFVSRLRGTRPFEGIEALKHQLASDIESARIRVPLDP